MTQSQEEMMANGVRMQKQAKSKNKFRVSLRVKGLFNQ
jgi:hypothetical protein